MFSINILPLWGVSCMQIIQDLQRLAPLFLKRGVGVSLGLMLEMVVIVVIVVWL
jgi:hypothetical protein